MSDDSGFQQAVLSQLSGLQAQVQRLDVKMDGVVSLEPRLKAVEDGIADARSDARDRRRGWAGAWSNAISAVVGGAVGAAISHLTHSTGG